ncbi:unnamed protein product [Blepharisma stoltei]|uniref:Uncharacterized protein n=1 Tax=Blepharisma stoltei TaxID=1481888 RepID=A0AAU9JPW4_9CILI|nr:unnamed protein product [Blepharisma stoltei]
MGVIASTPGPVKIYLKDIELSKENYVIDSTLYNGNLKYVVKACLLASKNKKLKTAVFKLYLPGVKSDHLSKAISQALEKLESVTIYGTGLDFFSKSKWIVYWRNARVDTLSIKFDISDSAFQYLCSGLEGNRFIRELNFKILSFAQLSQLEWALIQNSTVKVLGISCEPRSVTVDNEENTSGILSSYAPSQVVTPSNAYLLAQNTSIETYILSGYLENYTPGLILGLAGNQTVIRLILENIDMDRDSLPFFTQMFIVNSHIKEIETRWGFNTMSAMVLFSGLKASSSVEILRMRESTFFEGGYIMLKEMLERNESLKYLEIKDMLHLGTNSQNIDIQCKNMIFVIKGVTASRSLRDLILSVHKSKLDCDPDARHFKSEELKTELKKLLQENKVLRSLKIENFRLGKEEIKAIAEGLAENQSLLTLSLNGNEIDWKDLEYLARSLRENQVLRTLEIGLNKIYAWHDIVNLYGAASANDALTNMNDVFTSLSMSKIRNIKVTDWFWEERKYPASIADLVFATKQKINANSREV